MGTDGESTVKKLSKTAPFQGTNNSFHSSIFSLSFGTYFRLCYVFVFNISNLHVMFMFLFMRRSYYRCTTASCNVKKRVERSYTDPTIVVTTYEGQHIHPSPAMSRSAFAGVQIPPPNAVSDGFPTNFGSVLQGNYLSQYQQQQHHQHQHQQLLVNTLSSLSHPYHQERKLCNPGTSSFLRDHGLLQDVVPSHMLKEE